MEGEKYITERMDNIMDKVKRERRKLEENRKQMTCTQKK